MEEKERGFISSIKKYPALVGMILVIILIFSAYLIMDNSMKGLFGESEIIGKKSLTTEYGDNFVIVEKSFHFPESEYDVEIYSEKIKKKNFITKVFKENKDQPINLISIYKSEDILCYSVVGSEILYKQKGMETFKSIHISAFPNIKVDEYLMFIPVAQKLMRENNWKWFKVFSEFMVKAKDDYTIELLQRYSKNEFSDDEIKRNKDSGYTKEEIQKFSSDILDEYNLN